MVELSRHVCLHKAQAMFRHTDYRGRAKESHPHAADELYGNASETFKAITSDRDR